MSAPLSNLQKHKLVQLARRRFNLMGAMARGRGEAWDGSERAFSNWRHEQVIAACGKAGLRCCDQLDYKRVEAHFLHLLGEDGRAMAAHVQAETEPKRQAEAVLVRELKRFGLPITYAAAICRKQFKCALDEASVKQIWNLIYTVRNRGRKKGERQAERNNNNVL